MTIHQALELADKHFSDQSTSRYHSKLIVCEALKLSIPQLYMQDANAGVTAAQEADILDRLARLDKGEPFDYVVGRRQFMGLNIKITRDVLIPRPETEQLVQSVIDSPLFTRANNILEIGIGSGCVSVTLFDQFIKNRLQHINIAAIDPSAKALVVAKQNFENLHHLKFNKVELSKSFASSDGRISLLNIEAAQLAEALKAEPDIIVANPPYITSAEMLELDKSVSAFEPKLALDGGADGLNVYRDIAAYIRTLHRLPELYLEISPTIANSVKALFAEIYPRVEIRLDVFDRERFLIATSGQR